MNPGTLAAIILSGAVGLSLGALGGGGPFSWFRSAAGKVPGGKLQKAFSWFIILLGLLIGAFTVTGLSLPSRKG